MVTSQFIQISALVGFLLPLLIQFVQKEGWPNWLKTLVGIAACVAASFVNSVAQGKFNTHDILGSLIVIFTLTKLTYLSVYKPAGLAQPKLDSENS